ncbi:MAG: sigma-54 dependent transcriptional regulator [Dissulfuribacterales bacterium]
MIVGNSKAIQGVFDLIKKVATTDSTVLITGESGTGKELIAKAIHYSAPEANERPFIPVNCAAIPHELLESELFGHEKGAFTHAIRTRIGRFELANNGSIFLDEIAEMPMSLQVKLLRAIQERKFERVGGSKTISVNIRILAATNVNLEEAVKNGRFREDLYYRLNVIPIHIPPLRERTGDIPLLIDYFLKRFCELKRHEPLEIDDNAMEYLMAYSWPGNVRELENIIERLVILSDGVVITLEDLPEKILREVSENRNTSHGTATFTHNPTPFPFILPEEGVCLSELMEQYEHHLILQALERTGWVKNRAAKLLRMNRTTLVEKLKKLNITDPNREPEEENALQSSAN